MRDSFLQLLAGRKLIYALNVITPRASARNRSEVVASIRLVLMLPSREVFKRRRFITTCRTMERLLAAKLIRTVDRSSLNGASSHQ